MEGRTESGVREEEPPSDWLGGEAHVRFQGGRGRRSSGKWPPDRGYPGVALALAFLLGSLAGMASVSFFLRKR